MPYDYSVSQHAEAGQMHPPKTEQSRLQGLITDKL